jgi:hypothetical protein
MLPVFVCLMFVVNVALFFICNRYLFYDGGGV